MAAKEFHRIRALRRELAKAKVPQEAIDRITEGGEAVLDDSPAAAKATWMAEAMRRMDALLDYDTRRKVREGCACCLGSKRGDLMKAVARQGGSLEERIAAASEAKLVFPMGVQLQDDGRILVRFGPEGPATFDCPCIRQSPERISITYCQCCGGHVKHHLQTALSCKLDCEAQTSVLASGGQDVCSFLLTVRE
ncbi:MAG: DUF6144 family protein [Anaerolineae bacterium]